MSGFTIKSTSFQPDQNRECDPEQAVERIQARPGPFSFEHGNLLSEHDNLKRRGGARAKEDSDGGDEYEEEIEHELSF